MNESLTQKANTTMNFLYACASKPINTELIVDMCKKGVRLFKIDSKYGVPFLLIQSFLEEFKNLL